MKKIYLSLLAVLISVNCLAQDLNSDFGKISLIVILPENKDIPAEARQLLATRLQQIVTQNGIASSDWNDRFAITARTSVVQKDITPTNPPRISQRLEVTFMIGDVIENKIYETASITLTGVGANETRAFVSAFQNINPTNRIFSEMIEKAKEKIVQYYNTNCDEHFQRAKLLEANQQFAEAIYTLMQVPNVNVECYNNAQNLALELLTKKINFEGEVLLRQAQAHWTRANTLEGATRALALLAGINPTANCQPQVETLIGEINEKLRFSEKREWDLMMQAYKDDLELTKQHIEAVRQVAIEFGKNQPKEIHHKRVSLW
jgi:tetratricopeptide (TPR) repeat protein